MAPAAPRAPARCSARRSFWRRAGVRRAAAALPLGLGDGPGGAVWLGVKVALVAVWGALDGRAGGGRRGRPRATGKRRRRVAGRGRRSLARWPAWQIALAGAVLLIAGLQRAPQRLVLNLIGYALLSAFAVWVVQRRGRAARRRGRRPWSPSFAVVATTADRRPAAGGEVVRGRRRPCAGRSAGRSRSGCCARRCGSPRGSALREPLEVPLATAYDGPARGPRPGQRGGAGPDGARRPGRAATGAAGGGGAPRRDARARAAATPLRSGSAPDRAALDGRGDAGGAASSYFDGQRWRPGTFDDAAGRRQDGVYVLQLKEGA